MPEARLSVRVDEDVKKRAEKTFRESGLTLSAGIKLYLVQIASGKSIPFTISQITHGSEKEREQRKHTEEIKAQSVVENIIKEKQNRNVPVALYDNQQKRPYLQYPDGRQVYDIE